MRAAVHHRYGDPSVVTIATVDRPTPRPGQVLVRVRATTVNRTDSGYRAASPFLTRFFTGIRKPKRPILGTEYAGEVDSVGDGASDFSAGDRVFGYNEGPFGAHAEYLAVDGDGAIALIPDGIGFEEAAAATEGSHYALVNLRKAAVGDGQSVLIYGATGAIGSAAVQLAKSVGASVTAVCGTAHVDLVRGLGADRVVDYQTTDFTEDQQRYDFVFDSVGKSTFATCRRLLKPGGRFASTELGWLAQNVLLVIATRWIVDRKVIFAFPRHDKKLVEYLAGLLATGEFSPLIDRTYPLEEIVDAYRYVETGQKLGNVVITV